LHQSYDAIARGVVAGDANGARIDIAGQHLAVQQFRRGDRQDPSSSSDIERSAESPPSRQALESH